MSTKHQVRAAVGRPFWQRCIAALLSAITFVLAFPEWNQAWAAPLSVALLLWALHGARTRTVVALSALQALLAFGLLVHWVVAVAFVAWPALVAVMVVWRTVFGILIAHLARRSAAVWLVPACFVVMEWLQSLLPWGGFPWGRLSFAGGLGWFTRAASLVGAVGLTFILASIGTGVWLLLERHQWGWSTAMMGLGTLTLCAAAAPLVAPQVSRPPITVGIVQGGVPRTGLTSTAQERAVFTNHIEATKELLRRHRNLDLIIWPESSLGYSVVADAPAMDAFHTLVKETAVPILTGTVLDDALQPDKLRNRAMLWNATGDVRQTYDKQHLVPFGEFVPLRAWARRVTAQVDLVGRDFLPGNKPGVFTLKPGVTFGVLICFEVGYDELQRPLGDSGFIVNQTNNASYLGSSQPEQQFRMAQVRAAESGRMTLVAATSGVSGAIDGYGHVVSGTKVDFNETHSSVVTVPIVAGRTPGLIVSLWMPWLCLMLLLLSLVGRQWSGDRESLVSARQNDRTSQ